MAYEDKGKVISLPSSGDLSASQYCFVELNSSGQIALSGDGENAIGVLQDKPTAAGQAAQVMVGTGITKIKAGAAANVGDYVGSDASARGVAVVTGDRRLGQFLEAPTAANEIVTMLFQGLAASS